MAVSTQFKRREIYDMLVGYMDDDIESLQRTIGALRHDLHVANDTISRGDRLINALERRGDIDVQKK